MQSHNDDTNNNDSEFKVVSYARNPKGKSIKNYIQPNDYIITEKDKNITCVTMTIIVKNENKFYGLFSIRHANTNNGYITSQGGKVNKNEAPLFASLRETWEEVGVNEINYSDVKLLYSSGDFNHYYVILNKFPNVKGSQQEYYEYYTTNQIKDICKDKFKDIFTPTGLIWLDISQINNINNKYLLNRTLIIVNKILLLIK